MKTFLLCMLSTVAFAQGPFTEAITAAYGRVKTNLTATAAAMPEDAYSFRLTPAQRPFSEWITHTAAGNYAFCAGIRGVNPPSDMHTVDSAKTKAQIQSALADSFAYCDESLKNATDASPAKPMISLLASLNEHYGNLVGYLRAKGIVPPSTARASKKQ